jgi:hypothetical protein
MGRDDDIVADLEEYRRSRQAPKPIEVELTELIARAADLVELAIEYVDEGSDE